MKLLGTIQSIGAPRAFARQDGSYGNAYPVVFSCELGRLGFETFYTKDAQQTRGFVVGAVGYVEVSASDRTFTDKNGNSRISTDITVRGWELANRNISQNANSDEQAAQAAVHDAAQAAAASAVPAGSSQDTVEIPEGKLPF